MQYCKRSLCGSR